MRARLRIFIAFAFALTLAAGLGIATGALAQSDALPSWNDGPARQAIVEFVQKTTDTSSPDFAPPAEREYAYGPADGLPDTKFGTFPASLMEAAKAKGWVVISMKKDWKTVFPSR